MGDVESGPFNIHWKHTPGRHAGRPAGRPTGAVRQTSINIFEATSIHGNPSLDSIWLAVYNYKKNCSQCWVLAFNHSTFASSVSSSRFEINVQEICVKEEIQKKIDPDMIHIWRKFRRQILIRDTSRGRWDTNVSTTFHIISPRFSQVNYRIRHQNIFKCPNFHK